MLKSDIFTSALSLSPSEDAVLTVLLAQERVRVADLVRTCKLPRSTVNDALVRLQKRRLVRPVAMGKHQEWKVTDQRRLSESFLNIAELLQAPMGQEAAPAESKAMRVQLTRETEFTVYAGWRNIIRVYEREIIAHEKERVIAIQSTPSATMALAKVSPEGFIPVNDAIKKHGVIMEAIISPSMFELYKGQGAAWLASMEGRTAAMRFVSDEMLDFNSELLIFRDKMLMTHWQDEATVMIKNTDMLAMMRKLYRLLYEAGHTIDQNEFLRRLLKVQ